MTKIAVGVRVRDTDDDGEWATISHVDGSRFQVKWDSGQVGGFWWDAEDWIFDAPNDPRATLSPVRTETVTTRRLEPGVYGRVQVRDEAGVVGFNFVARNGASMGASAVAYLNAPELRELARVALEIAEYLDAQ